VGNPHRISIRDVVAQSWRFRTVPKQRTGRAAVHDENATDRASSPILTVRTRTKEPRNVRTGCQRGAWTVADSREAALSRHGGQ
jgi:hypothetical protein